MKTYLKYGAIWAGAGLLINVVLYAAGLHSSTSGLKTANWVGGLLGLGTAVACLVLGTKARRAEVPATEDFGYGSALGAGVMIALFTGLFSIATTYLYSGVINTTFPDVMLQAQAEKLEASGVSADKIEQIQKMTAMWMKPPVQAAMGCVFVIICGTVISLITAAFLKRAPADELQRA